MIQKSIIGKSNRIEEEITPFEEVEARILSYKESDVVPNVESHSPIIIPNSEDHNLLTGRYEISCCFDTYALGVNAIRNIPLVNNISQPTFNSEGSKLYRPLTLLESLEVMVNDYNTLLDENGKTRKVKDRERLFNKYKFRQTATCTGVAYKSGGKEIKIIPQSTELIMIPEISNNNYIAKCMDIKYNKIVGTKLDTSKAKYNQPLSKSEVLEHPAWIASVGDTIDARKVLESYADIVFNMLATKKLTQGMDYQRFTQPDKDQLWVLCVSNQEECLCANAGDLNTYTHFLLVDELYKNKTK
jgi:hypothetical protein